jgi:DNA-binding YbaB/EbfC family protein
MNFRGGMNELMRQAARMQRKIDQSKKELETKELTTASAGDKIKVTATYGKRVARIEVDEAFLKGEDTALVLDAITAGVNAAIEAAEKAMEAELEKITGGVKLPGGV